MDDNAPCHRARAVVEWMTQKKLKHLESWPPQSPDLNPIEHVWDILSKRMKEFRPKNLVELEARLKEEWACISC